MPWWGIALIVFAGIWTVLGTVWLVWLLVQFAKSFDSF